MKIRHIGIGFIGALAMISAQADQIQHLQTDVCVVGGGSGGIGAALAAARDGASVILVERDARLGGTSVNAYVCHWETGPGCAIAKDVYERLRKQNAVGITTDHNPKRELGAFGLWLITPGHTYEESLRRSGRTRPQWRAVSLEPDALSQTAAQMLAETGRCRTLLNTTFIEADADGKRVESIEAVSEDGKSYSIRAKVFIDSTGSVHLCRKLGCETMLGPDSHVRFNEALAPERPERTLNAISLCYRVRKSDSPVRQAAPDPPPRGYGKSAHVNELPNGDLIVNPLAMLPGIALHDMGRDKAMAECRRRVQAHWHRLQSIPTFASYEFHSFAPRLGIREGHRVVGEYVLTMHDLKATLKGQSHRDIIAVADHNLDVHGSGGRHVRGRQRAPYGIPYRCLIPKGWQSMLVACRGAGFSHIAASSCRLSRTMIAIGHAAGLAAAMAARSDVPVAEIDVPALREKLGMSAAP